MVWDVVVVTVRRGDNSELVRNEIQFLQEVNILSTRELIFVEDACEDAGSAGSLLNALLITAERLSALAGYSVLSEDVFHSSSVLILLIGSKKGAFEPVSQPDSWQLGPDTVIVRQLGNLEKLRADEHKGVWICGTDSCFLLKNAPTLIDSDVISVFTFPWETDTLHGSYILNEKKELAGIEYPSSSPGPSPIVLSLLHLPPSITALFLSLHSIYPLSASTYYGEDTGTLGLKVSPASVANISQLSLFFDLLMASCLNQKAYLESETGEEKIDKHRQLRRDARSIIWAKLNKIKSRMIYLQADSYFYFKGEEPRIQVARTEWLNSICLDLSRLIPDHSKNIQSLPILVAMDKIYGPEIRGKALEALYFVCESQPAHISRALYVLSEFLYLLARGRGGLRMGPAANPAFSGLFEELKKTTDPLPQIRKLLFEIQSNWMEDDYKLVRGARHVEAVAQIIYGKRTVSLKPIIQLRKFKGKGRGVLVEAAARVSQSLNSSLWLKQVDIFGGWLDTAPITYETSPSAVINMAIGVDNQLPLACEVRLSSTPGVTFIAEEISVTFSDSQELQSSATRPSDHGALVAACFVALGLNSSTNLTDSLRQFYDSPGITVKCLSSLPHGSGLGTSSILACCIISALLGEIPDREQLIHLVLFVEHLLTTGGGWQDQVGGVYPGIKIGEFNEKVSVRPIAISSELEKEINSRLVLIYTGKTRLAKNLLQEVLRNWYFGGDVVELLLSMQKELKPCEELLRFGRFPSEHVELYYRVKKRLATGCEPPQVASIIQQLKSKAICKACWLAGAGGGGFLCSWLEEGKCIKDVKSVIQGTSMSAHSLQICDNPILLKYL